MIPKIIHQTSKTALIEEPCASYVQNLKSIHHDWEYRFYTDEDCLFIIKRNFPELLEIYNKLPFNIQRADLFRVAVIYLQGGFYMDIDMQFHQAMDDLCIQQCVFPIEVTLTDEELKRHGHRDRRRLGNYAFGGQAGHEFLQFILQQWQIHSAILLNASTNEDVLESTGPGFITSHYYNAPPFVSETVHLLENGPNNCSKCHSPRCQFGEFASHLHMQSWRI